VTKPTEDFSFRWKDAIEWRNAIDPTLREVAFYCEPGQEREYGTESDSKTQQESETFVDFAEELVSDLAGDLVTYFTPAESVWATYIVTAPVEEDAVEQVNEIVSERERAIDDALRSSNYYDIAPQWGMQAASHGLASIWITRGHIGAPIFFEVIPTHEVYVTPSSHGYLDRFRKCRTHAHMLPQLLAGWNVDLTADTIKRKIDAKPSPKVTLVYGFWLDWSDVVMPMWRCEITVDGQRVTPEQPLVLGPLAGACPMLVGRFNPRPGRPWPRGPAIKALPALRTLDKVSETVLSGLDQALMNTLIYADDGFLDMTSGIVPGTANAASRGFTRDQVYELQRTANLEPGWFTEERIEERIRAIFYQDGPRQRGDTPPTASQWLDERRRVQQRLGKPSAPIWSEMVKPMIQRIEYLMVEAGEIEQAITLNGTDLALEPNSPLTKANNQDQVMVAQSNLQLAAGIFGPEALPQIVDPIATMQNIIRVSGDKITKAANGNPAQTNPPQGPTTPTA
jgi:hypothetical protein